MTIPVIPVYADLTLKRDRARQQGRPVNPVILRAIETIEAKFMSLGLNQQQINNALAMVRDERRKLIERDNLETRERIKEEQAAASENLTRSLTRGMLGEKDGLTPQQLTDLRDGKPVKLPARNPKPDKAQLDAASRVFTKQYDPTGRGFDNKRGRELLDEITDANDGDLAKLAQRHKVPVERLKAVRQEWKSQRLIGGLKEKRGAYDEPVTISPERASGDRRRAQIVDSMAKNSDESHARDYSERVSPEYRQEEGRRGDIARAFDAHDQIEESVNE